MRRMLEAALAQCPEVLAVGLAAAGELGPLQREVADNLTRQYCLPHPNSAVVLHRIWASNQVLQFAYFIMLARAKGV